MPPDAARRDANPRPLEGVRVLAQAIVWAGPFGSMILADLGAEVIEVESIQHISPTRSFFRHVPEPQRESGIGAGHPDRDISDGHWERYSFFHYAKRGHKSVTLDLNRERGRELFYELVRVSDAFIENNATHVVEQLGIDWPQLSELNPRLIMIRFPGFGTTGPYRNFRGFGATMEAAIGHSMVRGYRDADPSQTPPIFHADPNGGAHVAFALQAALWARERTGAGQLIDMSQAEAVLPHITYALTDYTMNGRVQPPWGNRHPSMAPYGLYPCREEPGVEHDHEPSVAIAVPSDEVFGALVEVIGAPQLARDARYADVVSRYRNQDDLEPAIASWTRRQTPSEAMRILQEAGVPAAMVNRQTLMHGDAQLAARGFFEEITHPVIGTYPYPGPMAKFEQTPLTPVASPAPTLGQHNEAVLRGLLGLSERDYQALVADEIIGTAYREDAT